MKKLIAFSVFLIALLGFSRAAAQFNPETRIKYSLSSDSLVKLEVFNLHGHNLTTLVNAKQSKGVYTVVFSGKALASGIYYCRFKAGEHLQVKRMLLVK